MSDCEIKDDILCLKKREGMQERQREGKIVSKSGCMIE